MIKIIGSSFCKNTLAALEEIKSNNLEYEFYDISSSLENLKKYLELRDGEEIYNQVKKEKRIGIPSFILEDGEVTLDIEKILKK